MQRAEFSVLVTRFSYSLKPFALSLTHDMADAKDLLQETVYQAFDRQNEFPEDGNLKIWLYTIMKSIFELQYSHKAHASAVLVQDTDPVVDYAHEIRFRKFDPAGQVLNFEVSRLPDDYRTPFLMHYQGFKYNEIADRLNLSPEIVKRRIMSARKELLKRMRSN